MLSKNKNFKKMLTVDYHPHSLNVVRVAGNNILGDGQQRCRRSTQLALSSLANQAELVKTRTT